MGAIRDKVLQLCKQEHGVGEPNGDDKYIKWYNANVNGWDFAMNVAWCEIWRTWIGSYAGLTYKHMPMTASCDEGANWFRNKKQYKVSAAYGGTYIPKAGDVVYYSSSHSQGDSTHVGWVTGCDGTLATVEEGNKSDAVGTRRIYLTDAYIIGYGVINYPDENGSSTNPGGSHLAGTGIGTAIALSTMNVRSGAGTVYSTMGSIASGSSVEVLEQMSNKWLRIVWGLSDTGFAYVSNEKPYFNVMLKEPPYLPKDTFTVGQLVSFIGSKHYKSADASKAVVCKPGLAEVTAVAKGKHPYHLKHTSTSKSNVYGWVDTSDIKLSTAIGYTSWVGKVTASVLNVRTGAGTQHGKLQGWPQLAKGNLVDVVGEELAPDGGKWYHVNIQGNKGYVHSNYIIKA